MSVVDNPYRDPVSLPLLAPKASRQCFVQWFLLLLGYIAIAFFATRLHVFQFIWSNDFTYTTSIIGFIFILMMIFLGVSSWIVDQNQRKANALTVVASRAAYICTLFGLLGTAVGLMYQVDQLAHVNPQETTNLVHYMAYAIGSLKTALLATAVGIVAAIGITTMNGNVEYFLDVQDENTI